MKNVREHLSCLVNHPAFKLIAVVLLFAVFSSCSLLKNKPVSIWHTESKEFYVNHSRLLGFELSGNENPALIAEVTSWLGAPYRYGGNSRQGVDCSGLVVQVFNRAFGLQLPRTTSEIARAAKRIKRGMLETGDLVFFKTSSTRKISHVGIYLGRNRFVHSTKSSGVVINHLDEWYWRKAYARAGRVLRP